MIKSSFKKVQKTGTSQKCYFGHPDLDAVFSNSLSKGHLMVIEQDHPTTYYLSLLRYYISSSYHKSIPSLVYDSMPNRWHNFVSPVLKKPSAKQQSKNTNNKSEIAWRYDKQNIRLNELTISEQIDYLDLSKQVEKLNKQLIKVEGYPHNTLQQFYRHVEQSYVSIKQDQKDVRPTKILLSTFPSYFYNDQNLAQFLQALRCMTRSSHVFTLITIPPIVPRKVRNIFINFSDYYLQLGKVGEGYQDFCASLKVVKQISTCSIKTNYRGQTLWGLKNKKKQILIQALYEQAVFEDLQQKNKGSGKPLCSIEKQQTVDF